jgi:hypothetical protein
MTDIRKTELEARRGQRGPTGPTGPSGQGGGELIVADIAQLAALDGSTLPDGTTVKTLTVDQLFELDKESVAAPNGITVVAAIGGGNWLRILSPVPRWTSQYTWYVNAVTGNDENDGASPGTPIASLAEIVRRLQVIDFANYTVNILSDLPSTDVFDFSPGFSGSTNIPAGVQATFTLLGTSTPAFSGAVTSAVGATPATNTPTQLTAGISWGGFVGKIIQLTSGALSGFTAVVLKDLGAGSARLSTWFNPANSANAAVGQAPAPGDTFEVLTLTNVDATFRYPGVPVRLFIVQQLLHFSPLCTFSNENLTITSTTCEFDVSSLLAVAASQQGFGPNVRAQFNGCVISPVVRGINQFDFRIRIVGSALLNCDMNSYNTARLEMSSTTMQGGQLRIGLTPAGFVGDTSPTGGRLAVFSGNFGLAVFDSPADGIKISRGALMTVDGPLWGSGNAGFGLHSDGGAKVMINAAITVASGLEITGASGDVENVVSPTIPALVAGAAVPASSPLTTWAQWQAAPFSRNVLDYGNGTSIINVTAPTT